MTGGVDDVNSLSALMTFCAVFVVVREVSDRVRCLQVLKAISGDVLILVGNRLHQQQACSEF